MGDGFAFTLRAQCIRATAAIFAREGGEQRRAHLGVGGGGTCLLGSEFVTVTESARSIQLCYDVVGGSTHLSMPDTELDCSEVEMHAMNSCSN